VLLHDVSRRPGAQPHGNEDSGDSDASPRSAELVARLVRGTALWDRSGMPDGVPATERASHEGHPAGRAPVRGSLAPTVSASSPQTAAGSDFSIFVVVTNPFEVPITLYQVQTHIPIEIMDVNRARLEALRHGENESASPPSSGLGRFAGQVALRRRLREAQNGIATAVGTEIAPEQAATLGRVEIPGIVGEGATITGVALNFPENPTSEEFGRAPPAPCWLRAWRDSGDPATR
jgi:hypothetical protein